MHCCTVSYRSEEHSLEGSLVRERPGGEGGMGVHMSNLPYAAPGIPKGRVAPVHGPERRIGTGDPWAVAQPKAVQRLWESAFRTPKRYLAAQAPRCRIHTSGSATGSAERRLKSKLLIHGSNAMTNSRSIMPLPPSIPPITALSC